MNLETGVNLGTLLLSLFVVVATALVGWGSLLQRVKTLEKEVESLSGFAVTLATMQAEISHIKSGIEQITGSWLFKEPPGYVAANPHPPDGRRRS
jgi:hypothetical protein